MSEPTASPPPDGDVPGSPRYVAGNGVVDLSRLTHDLRAPLNGVLGFAKLLHDGKAGPLTDRQRELAADVLECGQTLLRVIRQLEAEGARHP